MAKEPENPKTWVEYQEQVAAIRDAINDLEAPPQPDDVVGQSTFGLRHACEQLEGAVEARVRIEEGEDI